MKFPEMSAVRIEVQLKMLDNFLISSVELAVVEILILLVDGW